MKKIFDFITSDIIGAIGKVIDNLFTNDEERIKAKNEVFQILKEKELELRKMQTEVIVTEAQGNWLQRSWRPILMLGFGFIVMYNKFFAPAFNLPNAELENEFWNLLQLGVGGYVIGRSAEKIAKDVIQKR
tara:strand:- start:476 stop:868 length:393 start_codon:yes stop_codon:yes gene_type:complete